MSADRENLLGTAHMHFETQKERGPSVQLEHYIIMWSLLHSFILYKLAVIIYLTNLMKQNCLPLVPNMLILSRPPYTFWLKPSQRRFEYMNVFMLAFKFICSHGK